MGYDENNNVRLISEGNVAATPYGSGEDGSSAFSTSYLKDWLNTYFYNHIDNSILLNTSYCTDSTEDVSSSRTTCTNSVVDAKVTTISLDEYRLAAKSTEYSCDDAGLLLYRWYLNDNALQIHFQNYISSAGGKCIDFVRWMIDNNLPEGMIATYNDTYEEASINTSYLDDSNYDDFITLTPHSSTYIWSIESGGFIDKILDGNAFGVRPVITISSNISITGGNGTLVSPIMIEEANEKSGKLIDNAVSGEYVTLEDKIYRVVDKIDGAGTKLALDGYLQNTDTYKNMITKMGNNAYLTELGLTVGDSRLLNYTWDRGNNFKWRDSYTLLFAPSSNTFQSKVGGIRVGEMYSSQSDSIPIEKRALFYWTLTPRDSSGWEVFERGSSGECIFSEDKNSVRPSIMISSNTSITGGNGTLGNPYKI